MANKKDDITKDKDVKKLLSEIDNEINGKKEQMLEDLTAKIDEQIEFGVQKKFDQLEKKITKMKNGKILRRNIIIVILLAVSIYLAYCLYEIGYFNKDLGQVNNSSISQNDTLDTEKEEVIPASYYIEKYSYLVSNLQIPNNFETFKNGITKEALSNDTKLKIGYKNLSEESKQDNGNVVSASAEDILNAYKKICGEKETVEYTNFEYDNFKFLYFNDSFVAGKEEPANNIENTVEPAIQVIAKEPVISYQITNAYEQNNKLTFEVKYEGQESMYKFVFEKIEDNYYFSKIEK